MKKIITTILTATMFSTGLSNSAKAFEPFIGQIMAVGYNFCPRNWVEADGSLLSISTNSALFALYGTQFGGNGITNFRVPDLRGRAPMGVGNGPGLSPVTIGQAGGADSVVLTAAQLPAHTHSLAVKQGRGLQTSSAGAFLAESGIYRNTGTNSTLNSASIGSTGGSSPVDIRSPFTGITYCISKAGIFPSRP